MDTDCIGQCFADQSAIPLGKEVFCLADISREHKDRVFKFVFGNAEKKAWTLSLYNAVNGSDYKDPEEIQFNTIEDAVYMNMRNDVSFIISNEMNLWEHQSTFNPNMPLREYAWLVEKVRQQQKIANNIEAAVDAAVDEMPDGFELKAFLVANRAEVKVMFLTQYDEKKTLEMERAEGREEGRAEGEALGEERGKTLGATEANERMATDMLKDGEPISKIVKYSTLTEAAIRKLAKQLGVAIVL